MDGHSRPIHLENHPPSAADRTQSTPTPMLFATISKVLSIIVIL
jgi:hypothetical protein